jgi:lysophospholipase L1-like esterase
MGARGRKRARAVAAALAIGAAGVIGGTIAAGQDDDGAAEFTWAMPLRYGATVTGGLIEYPQSAEAVGGGPFEVDFTLRPAACRPGGKRELAVEGEPLAAQRLGPQQGVPEDECVLRARFEREGSYDVELHVEGNGDDATATQTVVVQDLLIVAIGDSIASGEGNPIRRSAIDPLWQDPRCHRSALAGTAQAAEHIERANGRSSVTFVHLACSGATVKKGLTGGYKGAKRRLLQRPRLLPAQLDELRAIAANREVDAVLLSVGGNDIGFSDIVKFCGAHSRCRERPIDPKKLELPSGPKLPLDEAAPKSLAQLPGLFDSVDRNLPDSLPNDRLYLMEYLDSTHATNGDLCPSIDIPPQGIDRKELSWAYDDLIVPLNGRLRAAADDHHWRFVSGVADGYRRHGYCADDGWVRKLPESLAQQGIDPKGTLHPNERGHRFTAARIDELLEPALLPSGVPREPRSPGEQSGEAADEGVATAERADDGSAGGGDDDGLGFLPGFGIGAAVAAAVAAGVALLRRR